MDDALLRVGLPPLPSIDRWLVGPAAGDATDPKEGEDSATHDFDDVVSGSLHIEPKAQQRDIPRLFFRPTQAVVVILLLMVALCASLTMLVTQAVNYNRQQAEASSSVSRNRPAAKAQKGSGDAQNVESKSGNAAGEANGATGTGSGNTQPGSATGSVPAAGQPGTQQSGNSNLVNLNTADSTQLQQIKGVGPVMAQKIIDYRSSIGRFTSVDQLLQVSGIGQKTLEKMRGQVTVS